MRLGKVILARPPQPWKVSCDDRYLLLRLRAPSVSAKTGMATSDSAAWSAARPGPRSKPSARGAMRVDVANAKLALRMLTEGMSIRATERTTGIHREYPLQAHRRVRRCLPCFLRPQPCGALLSRICRFDEQWTWVGRKQSRLTVLEKAEKHDVGDVYIWTCIDQQTKLMPAFMLGKRSADNARRFMMDMARRLNMPKPHASDAHAFKAEGYRPITQISTDGFQAYPEAVDLAFGPYVRYGQIVKEYRNATMIYTPSEMVGTKRTGIRGIGPRQERTICT